MKMVMMMMAMVVEAMEPIGRLRFRQAGSGMRSPPKWVTRGHRRRRRPQLDGCGGGRLVGIGRGRRCGTEKKRVPWKAAWGRDPAGSRGREAEQIKRWRRLIGEGSKKACYRVMGGGRSRSVHVGERAMGTALLLGYYNRNAVKPVRVFFCHLCKSGC